MCVLGASLFARVPPAHPKLKGENNCMKLPFHKLISFFGIFSWSAELEEEFNYEHKPGQLRDPSELRDYIESEGAHIESEGAHIESEGVHSESEGAHIEYVSEGAHIESEGAHLELEGAQLESEGAHIDSVGAQPRLEESVCHPQ